MPTMGSSVARECGIDGGEGDRLERHRSTCRFCPGAAERRRIELQPADRVSRGRGRQRPRRFHGAGCPPMFGCAHESFAQIGSGVDARQAATISAADSGASSTFGYQRAELDRDVVEPRAGVGDASAANLSDRPRAGMPSARNCGSTSSRNRSRPGSRPIELSMSRSVSAIRSGSFPRAVCVTVCRRSASSERATSGAASASRQPEALQQGRDLQAQALVVPVDLDDAAVAGAVPAGHGRPPRPTGPQARASRARPRASGRGHTRVRRSPAPAAQSPVSARPRLGVRRAPRSWWPARKPRIASGLPRVWERYGTARRRSPPTSSGRSTSSRKLFPSGPRIPMRSPGPSSARALVPGPIASEGGAELPRGAIERLIGRGSTRPGVSSMKNWARMPRPTVAPLDAQERVRPHGPGRRRVELVSAWCSSPGSDGWMLGLDAGRVHIEKYGRGRGRRLAPPSAAWRLSSHAGMSSRQVAPEHRSSPGARPPPLRVHGRLHARPQPRRSRW